MQFAAHKQHDDVLTMVLLSEVSALEAALETSRQLYQNELAEFQFAKQALQRCQEKERCFRLSLMNRQLSGSHFNKRSIVAK